MEQQYKNFPFRIKEENLKDKNGEIIREGTKLDLIDKIALTLLIVSGLNYVVSFFFHINLISYIVFFNTFLDRIVGFLTGISAIYLIIIFPKLRKK